MTLKLHNKKNLIFLIEDEPDIQELVSINLTKEGFQVKAFFNAKDLFAALKKSIPDLILLDIMLPDMDGFDICKELKKENTTLSIPIIMLTAKTSEMDKVLGLELGADDYITKPFSPRELVARVKSVLRRIETKKESKNMITLGNLITMDLQKYKVFVKEKEIQLTMTEFNLLKILAENPGWVLNRDQLLDKLWGDDKIVIDRTIDVHIRHLRKKLGPVSKVIKNIRGVGYKIEI